MHFNVGIVVLGAGADLYTFHYGSGTAPPS